MRDENEEESATQVMFEEELKEELARTYGAGFAGIQDSLHIASVDDYMRKKI